MNTLLAAVAVLLFACGIVFVLDGLFTFGLESILGGVFAVAAGAYLLQRVRT